MECGNVRLRRCVAEFIPLSAGRMWKYEILEKMWKCEIRWNHEPHAASPVRCALSMEFIPTKAGRCAPQAACLDLSRFT